jgi:hypothetical protein
VPAVPHWSIAVPGSTGVACGIPLTWYTRTAPPPYTDRLVPPGSVAVDVGVCDTPSASVHWSRSSVAFAGTTVVSAVPCQISTRGRVPVYANAARTKSPHWAGVRSTPGFMHWNADATEVAHRYGRPAMMAPPANTSG